VDRSALKVESNHWGRALAPGDWYQRVIRTNITPMKKLARSLKERIDNIVTYCTHGITNAVAEGINSKIMSI
jgi:transposase